MPTIDSNDRYASKIKYQHIVVWQNFFLDMIENIPGFLNLLLTIIISFYFQYYLTYPFIYICYVKYYAPHLLHYIFRKITRKIQIVITLISIPFNFFLWYSYFTCYYTIEMQYANSLLFRHNYKYNDNH